VYTFVGEPDAIEGSALSLFATALPLIDLRTHTGAHPRMGAVDVVPFVPLSGGDLTQCIASARRVAAEVARRYDLPVFLYEAAASTPARRRLEVVRRGEFEGLAAKLQRPEWQPDFGPAVPHPTAGASIIGARHVLIAFNIDLDSIDIRIAKAIASRVRESSGGLPGVKAIGVAVPHRRRVQVSTNVTNYQATPLVAVFDRVKEEADRLNVGIVASEIIGLAPSAALPERPSERIKLSGESRVLEERL
jgi:glutamate formiminotransferase